LFGLPWERWLEMLQATGCGHRTVNYPLNGTTCESQMKRHAIRLWLTEHHDRITKKKKKKKKKKKLFFFIIKIKKKKKNKKKYFKIFIP